MIDLLARPSEPLVEENFFDERSGYAHIAIMGSHDRCYPYLDIVDGGDWAWGVQARLLIDHEVQEIVPGVTQVVPLTADHCDICNAYPKRRGDGHRHLKRGHYWRLEIPEHNGKPFSARELRDEYFRSEYDPWHPFQPYAPYPLATDEEWKLGLPVAAELRTPEWERQAREDTERRTLRQDNKNRQVLYGRAYRIDFDALGRREQLALQEGRVLPLDLRDFEALAVRKGAADVALAAACFGKTLNEHHLDYAFEDWYWRAQYVIQQRRKFGDFPEFRMHREPGTISLHYNDDGSVRTVTANRHWRRLMERDPDTADMVAILRKAHDIREQLTRLAYRTATLERGALTPKAA